MATDGSISAELQLQITQFAQQAAQAADITRELGKVLQVVPDAKPAVNTTALQQGVTTSANALLALNKQMLSIPKGEVALNQEKLQEQVTAVNAALAKMTQALSSIPRGEIDLDTARFIASAQAVLRGADQIREKLNSLGSSGQQASQASTALNKLADAGKEAASGLDTADKANKRYSSGQFVGELSAARSSITQLLATMGNTGPASSALASNIAGIASSAGLINGPMVAAIGVLTAFSAAAVTATKSASELEFTVASVKAIKLDLNTQAASDSLKKLSQEVGVSTKELGSSLYNIFSSIDISQNQGVQLLTNFSKGAIAAQTDAKTFGTAIVGVLNAYKLSVDDANRISDIFFNTVKAGVVNGQELAAGLGPLTSSAKNLGVSFEELGALIVGVTKEGGDAAQNLNNLNNVFTHLLTKEATKQFSELGISITDYSGKIRPTIDILSDLREQLAALTPAAKAATLQQLFPDLQARQGVQTLLSQLDTIKGALATNREETGSTAEAYKTMAETTQQSFARLGQQVQAFASTVGEAMLPAANAFANFASGSISALDRLGQSIDQFLASDSVRQLAAVGVQIARGGQGGVPASPGNLQNSPLTQDPGSSALAGPGPTPRQAAALAEEAALIADGRKRLAEFNAELERKFELQARNEARNKQEAQDERELVSAAKERKEALDAVNIAQARNLAGIAAAVGVERDYAAAIQKALDPGQIKKGSNPEELVAGILRAKEAQEQLNKAYQLHDQVLAASIIAQQKVAAESRNTANAQALQADALARLRQGLAEQAVSEERANTILSAAKPILDATTQAQIDAAVAGHKYAEALLILSNAAPGAFPLDLLARLSDTKTKLEDVSKASAGAAAATRVPTEELKSRYTEIANSVMPALSENTAIAVKQLLALGTTEGTSQAAALALQSVGRSAEEAGQLAQQSGAQFQDSMKSLAAIGPSALIPLQSLKERYTEIANAALPSLSKSQADYVKQLLASNDANKIAEAASIATGRSVEELSSRVQGSAHDLGLFTKGLADVATLGADQARERIEALAKVVLPGLSEQQGLALQGAVKLGDSQAALAAISQATGKSVEQLNAIIHSSGEEFTRQSGYVGAAAKSLNEYLQEDIQSRAKNGFSGLAQYANEFTNALVKSKLAVGDINGAIAAFAQGANVSIDAVRKAVTGLGADAERAAAAIKSATTFQQTGRVISAPEKVTDDAFQKYQETATKANDTYSNTMATITRSQEQLETNRARGAEDYVRQTQDVRDNLSKSLRDIQNQADAGQARLATEAAKTQAEYAINADRIDRKRTDATNQFNKVVSDAHDKLAQSVDDLTHKYTLATQELAQAQQENIEKAADAQRGALQSLSQAMRSYNQGLVQSNAQASIEAQNAQLRSLGIDPNARPSGAYGAKSLAEIQQEGLRGLAQQQSADQLEQARNNYLKASTDATKELKKATEENTKAQLKAAADYTKAVRDQIETYDRKIRDANDTFAKAMRDALVEQENNSQKRATVLQRLAEESAKIQKDAEQKRQDAIEKAAKQERDLQIKRDRQLEDFDRQQKDLDEKSKQAARTRDEALQKAAQRLQDAIDLLNEGMGKLVKKVPTATENAHAIKEVLQLGPQEITNNIENLNETQVDFLAEQNAAIFRRVKRGA